MTGVNGLANGAGTGPAARGVLPPDPDEAAPFPEHLAAPWAALSPGKREMVAGPWTGATLDYRRQTDGCVVMLRYQGWTVDHVVELAGQFPDGLGKLSSHPALIRELWNGHAAEEAKRQQAKAEAEELRTRTSAGALLRRELPAEEHLLGSLITRTSRVFLVGPTGAGKSMLGLALAGGMSAGAGFLHWRSCRPARVLYIDGEMPLRTLQARVRDAGRRMGGEDALARLHLVSWQDADTLGAGEWAPFNTEAGEHFVRRLCDVIRPDVVIFDNVQSLIAGDMKDEVPWNETWPLIAHLTARQIGQVWIDHTGHNTTRQYGSSTKAWRFDSVGILTPLPREDCAPGETGFTLSFEAPGKARNRSPDTWAEYDTQTIRLRDDVWTGEAPDGQDRLRPSRRPFHDALTRAIARSGLDGESTREAWEAMCIHHGLIEPPGAGRADARRKPLRRAQSDLIEAGWIAIEGERVIDLHTRYRPVQPF